MSEDWVRGRVAFRLRDDGDVAVIVEVAGVPALDGLHLTIAVNWADFGRAIARLEAERARRALDD